MTTAKLIIDGVYLLLPLILAMLAVWFEIAEKP